MHGSKLRVSLLVVLCIGGLCLSRFLLPDFNSSTIALSSISITDDSIQHSKQIASKEEKQPYDVLILTYMRSGSKFIGQILGHRSDTFYWYEPFRRAHTWEYLSSENTWCNYGRPGCKFVSEKSMQSANKSIQYLLDLYTCTNLNTHYDIFDGFQSSNTGPTGAAYQNCKTSGCEGCPSPLQCKYCRLDHNKLCIEKMVSRCETTKHTVTKILRMDTTHAQSLLENHKQLKLVQLFRDPRAVINSRKNTAWYHENALTHPTYDAEQLCFRMEHDIDSAERLSTLFPDRVKILQYEDFNDPYRLAVTLYNFLNMEMTSDAETMLKNLMKADGNGKQGFHPDSYRQSLPWNTIQSINKACLSVFNKLSLRVFENVEEFKDMNVSVILDTLPYTINRIKREV